MSLEKCVCSNFMRGSTLFRATWFVCEVIALKRPLILKERANAPRFLLADAIISH